MNMMTKTKITDPTRVVSIIETTIAAALLAFSSIAFLGPVFAQTDDRGSSTSSTSSSNAAKDDYDNFQKCLSDAEGSKNYATEQEIRDCFNPIYGGASSSGTDNAGGSNTNNNPDNTDNNAGS